MPALRRRRRGDLRVVVNVVIPRRLTREQRELLEQLDARSPTRTCARDESMFAKLRARARQPGCVIRLASACRARRPSSCSPSCSSWRPAGSRSRRSATARRVRRLRRPRRAAAPARPEGRGRRRARRGLDERDRRRLARALAGVPPPGDRRLRRPARACRRCASARRGSAPRRRRRARSRSSSTPGRRSAPARTRRRACASSCCWSSPRTPRAAACSTSARGSGVLAIAAARLGFAPCSRSTTTAGASAPRRNAARQRRRLEARRVRPAHRAAAVARRGPTRRAAA